MTTTPLGVEPALSYERLVRKFWCSGCGLEIYPDEPLVPHRGSDVYHDIPYTCYPFGPNEDD